MTEKYPEGDDAAESMPREGRGDVLHRGIRAAAGSVPILGPAAVEVFEGFFPSPINARTHEWLESLARRIKQLEETHPTIFVSKLANDPAFVTLVIRSTEIAIRNHLEEKLEALRNAVINSIITGSIDESQNAMYLELVDRLTPWHLKILDLFNDPIAWEARNRRDIPRNMMGGREITLLAAFPGLKGRRTSYDQVIRELYATGLVSTDTIHGIITAAGLLQSITTEMGKQFMKFIASPE